jgi:D-alanine-D-alanine ligase-like ATP-grasp enzyme
MEDQTVCAFRAIKKVAPKLGIKFELEEYGFAGTLVLPNGVKVPFLGRNLNINPAASFDLAKDKGYTSYFLREAGFNVPDGKVFFSASLNAKLEKSKRKGIKEALSYAKSLGYPVFVKPNNLSLGTLVSKVFTARQLKEVAAKIFAIDPILIIERPCFGNDYRVVILDGKLISAYQRVPASVVGDGKTSVEFLLKKAQRTFEKNGRCESEFPINDFRVDQGLAALGLSRKSILERGQRLQLLANANLATGGSAVELTDRVHPSFIKIAAEATRSLGLVFCGADIMAQDITKPASSQKWWIIELNSNAQLNNHADKGKIQQKRLEDIYEKILRYILKKYGKASGKL